MTSTSSGIEFVNQWEKPNPTYPDGSYLLIVEGEVLHATGRFALLYPSAPDAEPYLVNPQLVALGTQRRIDGAWLANCIRESKVESARFITTHQPLKWSIEV